VSQSTTAVTLLSNGELDTLALGQGDPGLLLANDEDVALTGGEGVVNGVLDVDDVEASVVALTVGDDTDTAHVTTTSDHGDGASVELDEVGDLAGGKVDLDGVVDLDQGVRVTDAVLEKEKLALVEGNGEHTAVRIKLPSFLFFFFSAFLRPSHSSPSNLSRLREEKWGRNCKETKAKQENSFSKKKGGWKGRDEVS
jgi:hypothetical protein